MLLQTVSKILERVITLRLHAHANSPGLFSKHQCGSVPSLSVSDAAITYSHEIRTLQAAKLKVSTLFLDTKGGFDNVNSAILASQFRHHNTPEYMVCWIQSFLADCTCRLLFKGSTYVHSPINVGTPQGSPISPLLFVNYISPLHIEIPKGIIL